MMTPTAFPRYIRRSSFLRLAALGGGAALGGFPATYSSGSATPTTAHAPPAIAAATPTSTPTTTASAVRVGLDTPTIATQEDTVKITKNTRPTTTGPQEWFTGTVYIDTITTPTAPSRLGAASVHFTPGARTAWHTHPFGQTIWVTEGVGLCQREGGPVEAIRPGDSVFFAADENHWHGAAPDRFMVHLAMQEADDAGSPVTWGRHVTDEEYGAQPG